MPKLHLKPIFNTAFMGNKIKLYSIKKNEKALENNLNFNLTHF